MNPDGYEESYNSDITPKPYVLGRKNANNVDLNRDFPNLDKLACLLPTGLRSDHLTQAWFQNDNYVNSWIFMNHIQSEFVKIREQI